MFGSDYFGSDYFAEPYFSAGGSGLLLFSIDGKSAGNHYKPATFSANKTVGNRSRCQFELIGIDGYTPKIGQEVIIEYAPYEGASFIRLFGGNIATIKSANRYKAKTVIHKVSCVDFNALLDRRVVIQVYEKQPVRDVIIAIVEQFLPDENINTDNVRTEGLFLEKAVFAYKKVSGCFKDITTATGLYFYVDFYKNLYFFLRSREDSPARLEQSEPTSGFCSWLNNQSENYGIKWANLSVDKSSDMLKNNVYIIAGQDETDQRTESLRGDTTRQTFNLKYDVSEIVSIKINGSVQTFDDRDEGDPTAEWFYTRGEKGVIQNDNDTPIDSADILEVIYKGLYNVVVNQFDQDSITQRAETEKTAGQYQYVESDESIQSKAYAVQRAKGILRRDAKVPIKIFYKSDIQTLDIGQSLSVNLPDHDINIEKGFLVSSMSYADTGTLFRFKYELISTDNLESWQEFFKKIEFFGRVIKLNEQKKLYSTETNEEDLNPINSITWASGDNTDTPETDNITDWCVERAFHNRAFCSTPEVVRLGLI